MEQKNIVATIYIKDGKAVNSPRDLTERMDLMDLAGFYNDSGIDKILCVDLSDQDEEHEKNLLAIRQIHRTFAIKICGAGNIKRLEDVKKLLYAGCIEVVLNGSKSSTAELVKQASERFGKEKILVSVKNLDFVFKTKDFLADTIHELIVYNEEMLHSLEQIVNIPYILRQDEMDFEKMVSVLSSKNIRGICGDFIDREDMDVMQLKAALSDRGIRMDNFEAALSWADLKPGKDGLIPVITQDYQTGNVLMMAYMNEEAFNTTIRIGKMTYWSRSRSELWTKGLTSGHIQYVKSLTADCDYDTLLAKVSQVGGIACHTGHPSCFFNTIVEKEYVERNPQKVFDDVYEVIVDRKEHPKAGSYTNYLFEKGLDKILKKIGEEATEVVIAAKNPNPQEVVYEISDFLYHCMVLMAEKNVTWDDVTRELAQR
ncbi:MAG: bifunctional phosphoribosyl-AMP cyclohydrolase/phosphoribosyl-ATP diphosphatase HisIE [Lachnospiraceae bacterium]|nr:bifunctional phosphoribosyl-AMP cyclohydrolase/phosphoribosyl-ATP diphosphatase HisIE [Lachnospiraceae bacterium]